jgi:hypothetical protein
MKKRFKNIITSVFGIILLVIDIAHIIVNLFFTDGFIADVKIVIIWALIGGIGWIFLVAKDSLIEGITLKLLKIKE